MTIDFVKRNEKEKEGYQNESLLEKIDTVKAVIEIKKDILSRCMIECG